MYTRACVYKMGHYSSFKKENILQYATTRMNVRTSEMSHRKMTTKLLQLYEMAKILKLTESKSGMVVVGLAGGGSGELLIHGHEARAMNDECALQVRCTALYLQPTIVCCTLKIA